MKIKMIHTTIQELECDLPDEMNSIVDVVNAAAEAHKSGNARPLGDPRDLGHQVTSVSAMVDGKEVIYMVHRMGQIVVTEEGGMHFAETRELTIARKAQLEQEAEARAMADTQKAPEERTN